MHQSRQSDLERGWQLAIKAALNECEAYSEATFDKEYSGIGDTNFNKAWGALQVRNAIANLLDAPPPTE